MLLLNLGKSLVGNNSSRPCGWRLVFPLLAGAFVCNLLSNRLSLR